ncbi:hypothetical protein [Thermococcus celericrescens]|uniref:hypothetical protein n=1 Tax=Thermococcus celericrescens TaxID=227598 RepID=UPI00147053C8|nr:hypothetical protein [Thermococcus celericrescens]
MSVLKRAKCLNIREFNILSDNPGMIITGGFPSATGPPNPDGRRGDDPCMYCAFVFVFTIMIPLVQSIHFTRRVERYQTFQGTQMDSHYLYARSFGHILPKENFLSHPGPLEKDELFKKSRFERIFHSLTSW